MTARDRRVSKPPSRQWLSRGEKKGLAREAGVRHVTSNDAARSTASVLPSALGSFRFGGDSLSITMHDTCSINIEQNIKLDQKYTISKY